MTQASHDAVITVVMFVVEIIASNTPEIGQQCNLTCSTTISSEAEHLNLNITYQWYKDGAILSDMNDSTLVYQSLMHADAGGYVCEANVSSEHLIPSFTSWKSVTYRLCFPLGNFSSVF